MKLQAVSREPDTDILELTTELNEDIHVLSDMDIPDIDPQSGDDPEPNLPAETQCQIFGFMGAAGGTGVTSLCIQMAYDLAQGLKRQRPKRTGLSRLKKPKDRARVCIIDLDFENGNVAAYLDVKPGLHIEDLQGDADRLDPALISAFIAHHNRGIDVIAAHNELGGNDKVNPETVLALLDHASTMYDFVLLDIAQIWRPWTHAAIGAADHFALISEMSIPVLHLARARIEQIEDMVPMQRPCQVIINKHERRFLRHNLRLSDAEKVLTRRITGAVCIDGDTTSGAINRGEPAGLIRADGRYVRDTRSISDFWQDKAASLATRQVK